MKSDDNFFTEAKNMSTDRKRNILEEINNLKIENNKLTEFYLNVVNENNTLRYMIVTNSSSSYLKRNNVH